MGAKKGTIPPAAGMGRKKGVPNKTTSDVRAAIAVIAQNNIENVQAWLEEIKDPAKRVGLFLDLCEYHIPKLARMEHTGENGGPVQVSINDPTRRSAPE